MAKIVTKEIYDKIKAVVKQPKDDAAAMKKFVFGKSTIRKIRNTEDYQAYCERSFRFHGNPKRSHKKTQKPVEPDKNTEAELDELIKNATAGDKVLRGRAGDRPVTNITIIGGNINIL